MPRYYAYQNYAYQKQHLKQPFSLDAYLIAVNDRRPKLDGSSRTAGMPYRSSMHVRGHLLLLLW
jgi:hypothetical protein